MFLLFVLFAWKVNKIFSTRYRLSDISLLIFIEKATNVFVRGSYHQEFCSLAAVSVFLSSMVMVMGPTPPGTGVM